MTSLLKENRDKSQPQAKPIDIGRKPPSAEEAFELTPL